MSKNHVSKTEAFKDRFKYRSIWWLSDYMENSCDFIYARKNPA